MAKVLTYDGSIKIGAYKFPDRKKPCLCIAKSNECLVYGTFNDDKSANDFMNELADFIGAERGNTNATI